MWFTRSLAWALGSHIQQCGTMTTAEISTAGTHMHRAARASALSLFWQTVAAGIVFWPGVRSIADALVALLVGIGMIFQGWFLWAARRSFEEMRTSPPRWLPWVTL